jgi:starch phosphorylase
MNRNSILASISTRPIRDMGLPAPLLGLERLATNLYWTWHPEVQALFRRISPDLWAQGAGPLAILQRANNLPQLAGDDAFVSDIERAASAFDAYMASADSGWYAASNLKVKGGPIAYFCAEYGFHESLNQYAGGLGILAGDHCKEASDMGLPFIAVGLFYRRGFFHQRVDWEGRQEHEYPVYNPESVSVLRVLKPGTREPLSIPVDMPGRTVKAAVWLAPV